MPHAIVWIFESLLRLLLPARGRHRSAGPPQAARTVDPSTRLPRVPALRSEDIGLVRPYVVAPGRRLDERRLDERRLDERRLDERRLDERRQRARRRALVLATYGTGSRRIHGSEVPA